MREIQTSIDVLKEETQGLGTKVRVLEELREKVVSLKAEVDVGRQGCDACKFRVSLSSIFSCMLTNLFPRANNNIAVAGVDLTKKMRWMCMVRFWS